MYEARFVHNEIPNENREIEREEQLWEMRQREKQSMIHRFCKFQ